jgi:hypothetical protein
MSESDPAGTPLELRGVITEDPLQGLPVGAKIAFSPDLFRPSAPAGKPFDFASDPCVEQGLTFAYDEPATATTVAAVEAFLTAALK